MAKKIRAKKIRAWALVEEGKLCHYYALAYITFTKKQALIEKEFRNEYPLNHKMKVVKCEIKLIK